MILKKHIKTDTSNLQANDILRKFKPFHTCKASLDLLNKVNAEILDFHNKA